jgi:hypothetical protein
MLDRVDSLRAHLVGATTRVDGVPMISAVRTWSLALPLLLVGACSSSQVETKATGAPVAPKCTADTECTASADQPLCEVSSGACVALPAGHEIGYRDGTSSSVTFTEIYKTSASSKLIDLEFHPERTDELWAVGYGDDSIHIGTAIGSGAPTWKHLIDPAAGHFMHKPPALAMGTPGLVGTCGDNDNGQNQKNSDGTANLFMGPALFSTNMSILGKSTSGGLGSHVDMLHNTPLCRGIAHASATVFWVFNAYDSSIDEYNFNKQHQPGGDDHSDGEIYRFVAGKVKGATDGTSSHLFFDASDGFLYIADTGNARIVRLDTKKGTKGGALDRQYEPVKDTAMMMGTSVEEIVPAGTLAKPSGIEIHGDLVYVTDAATSTFNVYDKTGMALRSLATDLPAGSLSGFTFGPDEKIYFTDKVGGRILRIDPQ